MEARQAAARITNIVSCQRSGTEDSLLSAISVASDSSSSDLPGVSIREERMGWAEQI